MQKLPHQELQKSKLIKRTSKNVLNAAKDAAKKVFGFAKGVTGELANLSSETISNIDAMSTSVLNEISTIVTAAEDKVVKTKESVLFRLNKIFE